METTDATGGLSFDRATYATAGEHGALCAHCNGPLGDQYWQWQSRAVCDGCRGRLTAVLERSQSNKAFGSAVLLGGATALGCGILYAVFVSLTKYQLALATIGIAYVIAKVMRRCSAGVGGRRYQVLAVVLTYLASAMGYAPGVWAELKSSVSEHHATATGNSQAGSDDAPSPHDGSKEPPSTATSVVVALGLFLAVTLAAPVLSATRAPLGLLIIGFGLWEAWKLSRGIPLSLDGPYRAAKTATGPPAT
jgi:hypothetical protein